MKKVATPGKVLLRQKDVEVLEPAETLVDIRDVRISQLVLRVSPCSQKYPHGQKSYFLRYRSPKTFKQTWYKLGEAATMTVAQARESATSRLGEIAKGIDPIEAKRALRADATTLGEFIEGEYADTVLSRLKDKQLLDRLKRCFKDLWKRKLNDPTFHNAIQNWRARRLKGEKRAATVNRDIAPLKAVFQCAVDRGLIAENPLRKLKPIKLDKCPKVRYLSSDEEKRLMDALDKREEKRRADRDHANQLRREFSHAELPSLRGVAFTDHLKPMVILSLDTGMRRGEVFNLEWPDIDFNQFPAILTVRGDVAKSGSTRHIPLTERAVATLKQWKEQTGSEGLVFKGKNGGRFDNVNSSWEALLEDAKVTGFRWHDMRHDFASKLVMAGQDLNTVRELLGHADTKMTLRYAHLAPQAKAKAIELLSAARGGNVVPFSARAQGV